MKISCFVFYSSQIIETTATGAVDLEASKRRLRRLASDTEEAAEYEILLDLRGVSGELPLAAMYELAHERGRIDPPFGERIAILFEGDEHDGAVAPERPGSDSGYQVAHFVDFEAAMTWLSTSDDRE